MILSRILLLVLSLVSISAIAAVLLGAKRWAAETRSIRSRIAGATSPGRGVVDFTELSELPLPVQRYFRKVLKDGQPLIARVRISQEGRMNFSETGKKWKSFTAEQAVTVKRPGFVWDARVRMMPYIDVLVHDSYTGGEGALHAAVLGLITVGEFHGGKAMAEGELMRFLAEAVWYPTALLPENGVTWRSIDNRSALATLSDGETSVGLTFRFGEDDLITSFGAAARGRATDKKVVAAPWHGRFWNYQEQAGMMIPVEGEVSWILDTGGLPYWQGRTIKIEYEFLPEAQNEEPLYFLPAVQFLTGAI